MSRNGDRTGVPREARTLSGCDVGRIYSGPGVSSSTPVVIASVYQDGESVELELSVGRGWAAVAVSLAPTDLVTIRGIDQS
jgi:hypothetical protein